MADRKGEFKQLIGIAGKDPETSVVGQNNTEVLKFSLAVKLGFDEGATVWYDVAVFNEGLRRRAESEIHRGLKGVVVEGWASVYEGKNGPRNQITAERLGLSEMFAATRKGQAAPAPVAVAEEYANV